MRRRGLEPPRALRPTRPSTLGSACSPCPMRPDLALLSQIVGTHRTLWTPLDDPECLTACLTAPSTNRFLVASTRPQRTRFALDARPRARASGAPDGRRRPRWSGRPRGPAALAGRLRSRCLPVGFAPPRAWRCSSRPAGGERSAERAWRRAGSPTNGRRFGPAGPQIRRTAARCARGATRPRGRGRRELRAAPMAGGLPGRARGVGRRGLPAGGDARVGQDAGGVPGRPGGRCEQVVVVRPTTALRGQWADAADEVGLHLDPRWRNADGAWRAGVDGVVVTYQQMASAPDLFAHHLARSTFVVLDELHHAGESASWGTALRAAFAGAGGGWRCRARRFAPTRGRSRSCATTRSAAAWRISSTATARRWATPSAGR
jgi:hypothetical protein